MSPPTRPANLHARLRAVHRREQSVHLAMGVLTSCAWLLALCCCCGQDDQEDSGPRPEPPPEGPDATSTGDPGSTTVITDPGPFPDTALYRVFNTGQSAP